ncbi:hypothetical protein [Streptomyces sp. NRRL F-5123]|uniref:hypothetical protein n=1 Tax=Streptomyces sp. NRRL F-5123 TaxID=1463856 RepID=UPI0004E12750|nr:hypothetical protein [Streptomyces sp. NRRL F-5123]
MTTPDATAALRAAMTRPEPDLPECHLCGNRGGPWLPDPSGARWPSGAQMLICSRRCQNETADDTTEPAAAKDTPRGESTLPSGVLDLLAALRAALDVPRAALTDADEQARARLLHERTVSARIALNSVLDQQADLPGVVERLAERTADSAVTYTVWQSLEQAGGAG